MMAWRYIRAGWMQFDRWHYSQWISLVSLLGLGIGTAALVVVLSVYNGLEELTLGLYNRFNPELKVTPERGMHLDAGYWLPRVRRVAGVRSVSATLQSNALLRLEGKETLVWTKGVDSAYGRVMDLSSRLVWPENSGMPTMLPGQDDGSWVMVGMGLADALALELGPLAPPLNLFLPRLGAPVNPVFPEQAFGSMALRTAGVFDLHPEVNQQTVLVNLGAMREVMGLADTLCGALEVALQAGADPLKVQEDLGRLSLKAPTAFSIRIQDRLEQESVLLKVFASEKWWTFAFLLFIVALAALNLIGSLSMLVLQKRADIEVLGVLGLRGQEVQAVFWMAGMGIVFAGACSGLALGTLLCWIQEQWGLIVFPGQAGMEPRPYPVALVYTDLLGIVLGVLLVGSIFAWLPARRAVVYLAGAERPESSMTSNSSTPLASNANPAPEDGVGATLGATPKKGPSYAGWLKKLGWAGFFFFLIKGLLWLAVFYGLGRFVGL